MTIDFAPGPQSGGRAPAPGRLALVQRFANTFFDLDRANWGVDLLATPAGLHAWLRARGLVEDARPPTTEEHARALAVRDGLRAVLAAHNGAPPDPAAVTALSRAAAGLYAGTAVGPDGRTQPVPSSRDVAGALGFLLALVHEAAATGTWERLKACPGHHCGWSFYDQSRNQGSTWCSMRVCGSREKARAYRQRSRGGHAY